MKEEHSKINWNSFRIKFKHSMEKIRIVNSLDVINECEDFKYYELYNAAHPSQEFDIYTSLLKGLQIFRIWYGDKITVTCTYTPNASFGYHRYGKAIDITATKKADKIKLITNYNNELFNYLAGKESKIIKDLRKVGITGFGIEDTCIHFDIRGESACNRRDTFGKYLVFKFRCHYEKGIMIIDENRAI
jgi:hypothetical protein